MPFIRKNPRTVQIGPYAAPARTIYPGDGTSFVLPVGQTVDYSYGRVGPKTVQVVGSGVTSEVSSLAVLPADERSAKPIAANLVGTSTGLPTSYVTAAASVSVSGTQYLFYQRSFVNSLSGGKVTFSGLTANFTAGNYVLGSALAFLAGSIAMPTSSLFIVGITVATGLPACVTDFSEGSLSAVLPLSLVSTGDSSVLFNIDINADIRVVAYRKEVSPGVFSTTERWLNVGEDPRAEIGTDGSINLSYYSDGTRRGRKLLLAEESQWSFLNRYIRNASTVTTGGYEDGTWVLTNQLSTVYAGDLSKLESGTIEATFQYFSAYNQSTLSNDNYVMYTLVPNQFASVSGSSVSSFSLDGVTYPTLGLAYSKVGPITSNDLTYSGYFSSAVASYLNAPFSGSLAKLAGYPIIGALGPEISDGIIFTSASLSKTSGIVDPALVEYRAEYTSPADTVSFGVPQITQGITPSDFSIIEYKAEYAVAEDNTTFTTIGIPYTSQVADATIT